MSKYMENNLNKGEMVVKKAKVSIAIYLVTWLRGMVLFWLLFIPVIQAITRTIRLKCLDLGITNRRVIGKIGIIKTQSMDAPLSKVQNTSVSQSFLGKLFNYGTINIDTAAGSYHFTGISNPEAFKRQLMAQIDQAEEDRMKAQAEQMARAIAGAHR